MRDWAIAIPKRVDGTGYVKLRMRAGNMRYFGLDQFPAPKDYGVHLPSGNVLVYNRGTPKQGANNGSFRIAYEAAPGRSKPHMVRFRLDSGHVMETLQVLTDMLNSTEVPWLWLTNAHGNQISRSCFMSDALFGKRRACTG